MMRILPQEPTPAMMDAVRHEIHVSRSHMVWTEMAKAAPSITHEQLELRILEALGPRYIWARHTEPVKIVVNTLVRIFGGGK